MQRNSPKPSEVATENSLGSRPSKDEKEIFELYKNLKRGFDSSDWDLIEESIDYLSEYIDLRDDDETLDELN